MNRIDDLRRTLDERATGLVDHEVNARSSAVHHRITVVRRRRRAGGAAATAAVLAVAAGLLLLPDSGSGRPAPAEQIVGVKVPAELNALGYTYEYSEGIEGENGRVEARLGASDEPRLVSWATSGDGRRVRVTEPLGDEAVVRDSADFMDWVYVPAGSDHTVRITTGSGEPGLAVYTLGDKRPDGITQGGVTFRESVAGQPLIDATVGAPGQSDLTIPATAKVPGIAFHYFCSGGPADGRVDVYIAGKGPLQEYGPCQDQIPVDGADARSGSFRASPGEDVTLRLVVRDGNGDVVEDPNIRLGVGLYSERFNPITIDGAPDFVEHSGHRWELFDLKVGDADRRAQFVRAPRDRGVVVAVVRAVVRDASVELGADGSVRSEAGGGTVTELVGQGGRTGYRVVGGDLREGDRFQIGLYQRAD